MSAGVAKRPASPGAAPPSKRSRAEGAAVPRKADTKPWWESYFGSGGELYFKYMNEEWGVPVKGKGRSKDDHLFEVLTLEGAQAGLSWSTVLNKREAYRKAFDGFNIAKVAKHGPDKVEKLLKSQGKGNEIIIRHRGKVESVGINARACLKVVEEFGSFSNYLWSFVGTRPIENRWRTFKEMPTVTDEARAMSKDMKRRGFKFVGPTICYAFMQAVGMVNDHLVDTSQWRRVHQIVEKQFGKPSKPTK